MTFNEKYNLLSIYQTSLKYYKSKKVDDKKKRMKLDIVSAKITLKNGFNFNRSTRNWEQDKRIAKLTLMVSSQPVSYKKNDSINIHKFPVIFQFKDVDKGSLSPFKWRTGSEKRWIKKIPTLDSKQIANLNILNQVQAQFMFELEFVLRKNNLLYGQCRANRPPSKTNPRNLVYFDKHALFCCEKIILNLLNNKEIINRVVNKR